MPKKRKSKLFYLRLWWAVRNIQKKNKIRRDETPVGDTPLAKVEMLYNAIGTQYSTRMSASGYISYVIGLAFDGSLTTYHASNSGCSLIDPFGCTNVWHQWDFGHDKEISQIRYMAHAATYGFPGEIRALVSDTGDFTGEETDLGTVSYTANPGTSVWGEWLTFAATAVGRYLRIVVLSEVADSYADIRIKEIELKELVALGSRTVFKSDGTAAFTDMVSASSTLTTYVASLAFNGTLTTGSGDRFINAITECDVVTKVCTGAWYQFNFGAEKTMSGIRIGSTGSAGQNYGFPSDITVEVSDTGAFAGEETVIGDIDVTRPGGALADDTWNGIWSEWVDFPAAATGQYLRLKINAMTLGSAQTANNYSIGEIELLEGALA